MSVHIRLSSTLRTHVANYNPAIGLNAEADGKTVTEVARELGLPLAEIKFSMLNGRLAKMEDMLKDGDRLAFFPAVGGG